MHVYKVNILLYMYTKLIFCYTCIQSLYFVIHVGSIQSLYFVTRVYEVYYEIWYLYDNLEYYNFISDSPMICPMICAVICALICAVICAMICAVICAMIS